LKERPERSPPRLEERPLYWRLSQLNLRRGTDWVCTVMSADLAGAARLCDNVTSDAGIYLYSTYMYTFNPKAGSLKRNTALEYSTRVVQEGGRRCKKSTLNDLVQKYT